MIPEPEVKVFDLQESDQFMIMASDGVWEFISSQVSCNCNYKKHSSVGDGGVSSRLTIFN